MIDVKVRGRSLTAIPQSPVTAGSVGLPVRFTFSSEWEDLVKTAVFRGSDVTRDVALLTTDECSVPAETVANAGGALEIGVYGRLTDGTLVMPTVWGRVEWIQEGTEPSEVSPADPEPDWTAQVQAAAASALQKAETVEAAAANGDFDGATFTPAVSAAGVISWTNNKGLSNPESVNIRGPEGASAYEQAVNGGYDRTEAQFNAELANFANLSTQANNSARNSEAWAVGERGGVPVGSSDATYHNNAKYWADRSEQNATDAGYTFFSVDTSDGHLYVDVTDNLIGSVDFQINQNTGRLEVQLS